MRAIDVVRGVYEAFFGRHDLAGVLAHCHPDIEVCQRQDLPWGGVYRGHAGVRQFFGALVTHIDTRVDIDRLFEAGDTVVEVGTSRGRARASGRDFAVDETHLWTVHDGYVVRMEALVDEGAMRAALG